jgi:Tol biopolymer transport system component
MTRAFSLWVLVLACVTSGAIADEKEKSGKEPRVSVKEVALGKAPVDRKKLIVSPDNRRVAYIDIDFVNKKVVVVTDGVRSEPYDDFGFASLVFSGDGKHVGYTARRGDQWMATVDGVKGKAYPAKAAGSLRFSPDGKRVFFVLVREATHAVVDDKLSPGYDGIGDRAIVFSPDGKRLAYVAIRDGKQFVVVDGVEQKAYDGIDGETLFFSSDGKRLAYVATLSKKQFVVLDGVEGKHHDKVLALGVGFSPDGKRFHYAAETAGKTVVVSDGKEGKEYEKVARLQFSSDGRRTVYGSYGGKQSFVVIDGVEKGPYEDTGAVGPFSPDGQRLAYAIKRDGKWRLVLDGNENKPWDLILRPGVQFSSDGKRFLYTARQGRNAFAVIDGVESKPYESVRMIAESFSSDGKRVAFLANIGKKAALVVDGKESTPQDGFLDTQPVFSPDGKRIAAAAAAGDGEPRFALIDGVEGPRYDRILPPVFSPDSASVAYQALRGEDSLLVVDNVEVGPYANFFAISQLAFDSPTTLHFLASRDENLVRVEVTVDPRAPVPPPGKNRPALSSEEIAALVTQLASTNKRPRDVKEPLWVQKQPILPPGFDPNEQTRIDNLKRRLARAGAAAFPHLIDRFDDERYCVVVQQISSEAARNVTVGWMCRTIVLDQLQPYGFYSQGGDELGRPRRPLYPFPETKKDAAAWWSRNNDKTLILMQREVLDWVIAKEADPPVDDRPYPQRERQYLQELRKRLADGGQPLPPGNSSSYVIIRAAEFNGVK